MGDYFQMVKNERKINKIVSYLVETDYSKLVKRFGKFLFVPPLLSKEWFYKKLMKRGISFNDETFTFVATQETFKYSDFSFLD